MVPNFASHLIAAASLAIPFMIVSETSLSFLGLGLQAPAISWGVLLKAASNARTVASLPWLMIPAIPVIISKFHGRRPARRRRPLRSQVSRG